MLNGDKRYITNGGIAGVLTVMARTPDPKEPDGKVTAFLVTPDMPGFEVLEARMDKVGIRGTATARLAFNDMFVPKENILGEYGKGLRLALTVLDFGRTTFGASCTGLAEILRAGGDAIRQRATAVRQVARRVRAGPRENRDGGRRNVRDGKRRRITRRLSSTRGAEDYMLETSMIKLFASDALWRIVNDTLQIHGGAGLLHRPALRAADARRAAQPDRRGGQRRPPLLQRDGRPPQRRQRAAGSSQETMAGRRTLAHRRREFPSGTALLQSPAGMLAKQIARFARGCTRALISYREDIIDHEFVQARLGDTATELFHASCVYCAAHGPTDGQPGRREHTAEGLANRALLPANRLPPQRGAASRPSTRMTTTI